MSTPDIHHLAAAYALDAVDDAERAAFEAHARRCDVCRADVRDHRETLAAIAAATPTPPAAAVRDRVLAEIRLTRQLSPLVPEGVSSLAERRRRRRRMTTTMLAAAAALVLVVTAAVFVTGDRTPSFGDQLAAVLDEPDGRLITLPPTDATGPDGAVIRVAWSAGSGRALVLGDGLAPAPTGRGYELWLIDATGPVPMRLLDAAADGELRAAFDIDADTVPAAWGITIEPSTGSDAPTGDILYLAET